MEGPESLRKRARQYEEYMEKSNKERFDLICKAINTKLRDAADLGKYKTTVNTRDLYYSREGGWSPVQCRLNDQDAKAIKEYFETQLGFRVEVQNDNTSVWSFSWEEEQ